MRKRINMMLLAALAAVGCEQRPAPPPPPPPAAAVVEETTRPTTQQLVSGPYKELTLPGLPLAVQVPQSWTITQAERLSLLEGPTPADTATIQFAQRDPLRGDDLQSFIDRLKKEGDQQSGALKLVEFRDAGNGMQILERRWSERPMQIPKQDARGMPITDASGNPQTISSTPLRWSLMIFVRVDDLYQRFEFNAIGLTAEQYPADKPVLDRVFNSVKYVGATTAPARG
jgi:hypothetical protein